MSTLTGVIKAATRLGISVTPAESDLWVDVDFLYISSTLYPIEFEDGLSPIPLPTAASWLTPPLDILGVSMLPPSAKIVSLVRYLEYGNYLPESMSAYALEPSVKITTQVRYLTYDKGIPEILEVSMRPPTINLVTSASYVDYVIDTESLALAMLPPIVKVTSQ